MTPDCASVMSDATCQREACEVQGPPRGGTPACKPTHSRAARRVLSALAYLLAAPVVAGCARPASQPGGDLITTMRELTVAPVLTKETIERALEIGLTVDANSHEMVRFFSGLPRPGSRFDKVVKVVDLRVPTSRNEAMRDPFLLVELREDAGMTAADAQKLLGRPDQVDVPEPNPDTKVSYVYAFGPHRLWISIGHAANDPLRSLSVHRNEASSSGG